LENEAKREEKDYLPDMLEAMKTTVKLMFVYVFSACVFPFAFLVFLSEFIPLFPFPPNSLCFGLSLAVSPPARRLLSAFCEFILTDPFLLCFVLRFPKFVFSVFFFVCESVLWRRRRSWGPLAFSLVFLPLFLFRLLLSVFFFRVLPLGSFLLPLRWGLPLAFIRPEKVLYLCLQKWRASWRQGIMGNVGVVAGFSPGLRQRWWTVGSKTASLGMENDKLYFGPWCFEMYQLGPLINKL